MIENEFRFDSKTFETQARRGKNILLVEVSNNDADWGFSLRIEDQSGKPLTVSDEGHLLFQR